VSNNEIEMDEDWRELSYALENFDADNWSYAFNYIRKRCCEAEKGMREVAYALKTAAEVKGKDSDFYSSLSTEAERIFDLWGSGWYHILARSHINIHNNHNGKQEAIKAINLIDHFKIEFVGDDLVLYNQVKAKLSD